MGRLDACRVLVTRPRGRAEELCKLLEAEGAEVVALPLLELVPPENQEPLRRAAEQIHRFRWIAVSSPAAVKALAEAARQAGTISQLGRSRIAAIGRGTAEAVRQQGLAVEREASASTGSGLFDSLRDAIAPSDEVLLPAAQEGRRELQQLLERAGVKVTRVDAYRAIHHALDLATVAALRSSPPRLVLFASPRTAQAFLEALGEEGRQWLSGAAVVAIGPTTAAALAMLGVRVSAVAEQPTSAAFVDAAARAIHG